MPAALLREHMANRVRRVEKTPLRFPLSLRSHDLWAIRVTQSACRIH